MSESSALRFLVTVEEVDSDIDSINGAINLNVRYAELDTEIMDAYLALNGVSDSVDLAAVCEAIQAEVCKHLNSITLDISLDAEVTMFTPEVQAFPNVVLSEVGLRISTDVATTALLDALYYCADVISTSLGVSGRYSQIVAGASEPKLETVVPQKITPVVFNNKYSVVLAIASDSGEFGDFGDTLDNIFLSKGALLSLIAEDYPVSPDSSVVRFDAAQLDVNAPIDPPELDAALRAHLTKQREAFSRNTALLELNAVCSEGHASLLNYTESYCDVDCPSVDTVTQFIADMPQLTRVRNFAKCHHAIRRLSKKFGGQEKYCGFIVPTNSTIFGNFGPFLAELVQEEDFDPECFAYSGTSGTMFVMHDKRVPEHIVNRACADSLNMDWTRHCRPETYTLVMVVVS